MDNEATRILNPQQSEEKKAEVNDNKPAAEQPAPSEKTDPKKDKNKAAIIAGVAAAGLAGGAATAAAMKAFGGEAEAVSAAAEPSSGHHHHHHSSHHESHAEAPAEVELAADGDPDLLDDELVVEVEEPGVIDEPSLVEASDVDPAADIHVTGVGIVDDGFGDQVFAATIEDGATGTEGIAVDFDMDGTIDVVAVDFNRNDEFEVGEVVEVSDYGIQDSEIIDAYTQEQYSVEEQSYAADDAADYSSDVDTSMYDV